MNIPQVKGYKAMYHRTGQFVYAYMLLLFLYKWYAGNLICQVVDQPLLAETQYTIYNIFKGFGFPTLFSRFNWLGVAWDGCIFALLIFGLIAKNKRITSLLLFPFLIGHLVIVHLHTHVFVNLVTCYFIALIPFCFSPKLFDITLQIPRYYLAFIMVAAGIYKFYHDGIYYTDQMRNILITQHLDAQVMNARYITNVISNYLILHPLQGYLLYAGTMLLELSFVVAFFTSRFDTILFIFCILFVVGLYFVMRVYNADMFILSWFLLIHNFIANNEGSSRVTST